MRSKDRTPIRFRQDRTHEDFVSYVWCCHPNFDLDKTYRNAMFRSLDYLAEVSSLRDWPRLCREVKEEGVLRETGTNRPLLKPRPFKIDDSCLEDLPPEKNIDPPSTWYRTVSTSMFGDPITEIKTSKPCPTTPRP